MNKWVGVGRLVRDPEMRTTQAGKSVCNFTVAVDRRMKQENGPTADFLPCVAFGKTAEFVSKFFTKGKMVALDGRIQTRNWDDDKGQKHYATEIMVDNVEFCGGKTEDGGGHSESTSPADEKKCDEKPSSDFADVSDDDGELPFK